MSHDIVFKIKSSIPSLIGIEAEKMVQKAFQSSGYTFFTSQFSGMDTIAEIADFFISNLAALKTKNLGEIKSIQPAHVLHFISSKNNDKSYWGLVYTNGLVLYSESKSDPAKNTLMIFMDSEVSKENGFETTKVKFV